MPFIPLPSEKEINSGRIEIKIPINSKYILPFMGKLDVEYGNKDCIQECAMLPLNFIDNVEERYRRSDKIYQGNKAWSIHKNRMVVIEDMERTSYKSTFWTRIKLAFKYIII